MASQAPASDPGASTARPAEKSVWSWIGFLRAAYLPVSFLRTSRPTPLLTNWVVTTFDKSTSPDL